MTDGFAHPADLAVASFADADEDHRLVFAQRRATRARGGRRRPAAVDHHALREPTERAGFRHAADARFVEALDAVARMGEPRGQLAVVGQEQQAFGVVVEPSDRVDALAHARQQVDDSRPALGIGHRRHIAARFVQQEIAERLAHGDPAPVDADVILFRVGFRSELAHDGAIDADASLEHQAFSRAPGGDTGRREDFLDPGAHAHHVTLTP